MKYQAINGFTKEQIIETIKQDFTNISTDELGSCSYRGQYGAMCAVGLFIPNELYSENMENKQVDQLLRDHKALSDVMPLPLDALNDLQNIHDMFSDIYTNSEEMRAVRDARCKEEMLEYVNNNVIGECPLISALK